MVRAGGIKRDLELRLLTVAIVQLESREESQGLRHRQDSDGRSQARRRVGKEDETKAREEKDRGELIASRGKAGEFLENTEEKGKATYKKPFGERENGAAQPEDHRSERGVRPEGWRELENASLSWNSGLGGPTISRCRCGPQWL